MPPAAPAAASYSAPAAPASSASGLESLAAYISANYMGMGKSAADALPELRRKGITASGSGFVMNGQRMDAAGIASALRLQVKTFQNRNHEKICSSGDSFRSGRLIKRRGRFRLALLPFLTVGQCRRPTPTGVQSLLA